MATAKSAPTSVPAVAIKPPDTTAAASAAGSTAVPATAAASVQGHVLIALSAAAFTLNNTLVHVAAARDARSVLPAVLIRSLVHAVLSLLSLASTSPPIRPALSSLTRAHLSQLAGRAVAGAVALTLLYVALAHLPLLVAIALYHTTPVFTLLLAHLFLSDHVTPVSAAAAGAAVGAVALLLFPLSSPTYQLAALLSAAVTAAAYVSSRYFATTVYAPLSTLCISITAAFLSATLIATMPPPTLLAAPVVSPSPLLAGFAPPQTFPLLLVAAFLSYAAHLTASRGFQLRKAGPGILLRNLELPFAFIPTLAFLRENPPWNHTLATLLIIASSVAIAVNRLLLR